ncbi:MAG: MarR family transcriptional regulator, partial [Acidobacteriota bacterium]
AYRAALDPLPSLAEKVTRLAELRDAEGYMAESREEADGGFLLLENHCPICAAATTCQALCRSELEIFRAALGPGVTVERQEHILAGTRRCAYRIASV